MSQFKKKGPLLERPTDGSAPVASQISARNKIIDLLTRVEVHQAYTDKLLENELHPFSDNDRGLITEVVNGVLRWRQRLDWYLKQLYVGELQSLIPEIKNNLRASIYQLLFLDRIPAYAVLNEAVEISKKRYNQKTANLVNAILRNYLRQQKKLEYAEMNLPFPEKIAVTYSHPEWLVERWVEQWGIDDTIALCKSNNSRPVLSVRINLLRTSQEAFRETVRTHSAEVRQHALFGGFYYIEDFSAFRKLALLDEGLVVVQDCSTAIPVTLLDPQAGEHILDMCAAPGGKSSYIAEKMQNTGSILALEKHSGRAGKLVENLNRLGVTIVRVEQQDALQFETADLFDRILLDAPCSGLGVLSKRVDLRWKRTLKDIEEMRQLQLQMLEKACELLKPGGILVYSTCTIEPLENENVIAQFLQNNPQMTRQDLRETAVAGYLWDNYSVRTFPHRHQMDGSFAVKLQKAAN